MAKFAVIAPIIFAAGKAALIGAASGALVGGASSALSGGNFMKGALQGAKFGAITGGIGGALGGAAGALGTMGGKMAGAASLASKGANLMAAHPYATNSLIGAGVGAAKLAGGPGGVQGAIQGGMTGFGMAGVQELGGSLISSLSKTGSGTATLGATGGTQSAGSLAAGGTPLSGSTPAMSLVGGGVGNAAGQPLNIAASAATKAGGSSILGDLFGGATKMASGSDMLGGLLGAVVPNAKNELNPTEALNKAQAYYKDQWGTLPQASRDQLTKYVNTPIEQLAQEFMQTDDRGLRILEEKYNDQKTELMRRYTEAGQDPLSSSDAQDQLRKLDMQYQTSISEHQEALKNQALDSAVAVKKDVFAQSVAQQNADYTVLMDIAGAYGYEQEVKTALNEKNTSSLRELIARMFSSGTATKKNTLNIQEGA